jgi:hypothetical protein
MSGLTLEQIENGLVAAGVPREKARWQARQECGLSLVPSEADQAKRDERLEKEHELNADRRLAAMGFEIVKFSHPGRTKQTPGIADRRYYHRGHRLSFWWEAKSATGTQRPDQRKFQELVEACGDLYVLGTDQDLFAWLAARGITLTDAAPAQ